MKESLSGDLLAVDAGLSKLLELDPATPLRVEVGCASCLVDGIVEKLLAGGVKTSLLGCVAGQINIDTALKLVLGAIRGEVPARSKGSISQVGMALDGLDYAASTARHWAWLFGAATDR